MFSTLLGKLCRKHYTKVVIFVAIIYLICAVNFFGEEVQEVQSTNKEEVKRKLYKPIVTERQKIDTPLYQPIDPSEEHRKRRIKVLEQVYAVPHPADGVYKLNESLSRTISLDREPADLRPQKCKELSYDRKSLPTVSVIFPIYNEALSMLLRAVHSVINQTPQNLLVDVILVDDDSKNENLKQPLDDYVALLPSKVRVLRNDKREGLIRARMRGAAVARGDVLMFQDVHTEFSAGWAEPILSYIQNHPNTIVQPVVEELQVERISWPNLKDIRYEDLWRGVFMWDMRYAWNMVPKKYSSWQLTEVDPWPNPVLVGCSLAVGRKWFDHIGGFDSGLNIWGGENIEISLRTWMCGGRMIIHPCSRIAHVFKPFSYSFDGDKEKIISKNSIRVVETWMDDYRHYFYATNFVYPYKRVELDDNEKQSLIEHKNLRERLKCKSFQWYLENVLPEMNLPTRDMVHFGEVQNLQSKACWMVDEDGYILSTPDCYTYSRLMPHREFGLTRTGELLHFGKCVTLDRFLLLKVDICGSSSMQNGWTFEVDESRGMQVGMLKYTFADGVSKCVQQITNIAEVHTNKQMPQLLPCNSQENWQKWYITYNLGYHLVPDKPV